MAKGYDLHRERMNKVSEFGKELTRRAKSKCELCEATGVKLQVYEVPPVKDEPEIERCVFICDDCRGKIDNLKKVRENDLRFLSSSIWSEVPMAKALSIYLLKAVGGKFGWAEDMLEDLYIDEETEELVKKIEL